VSQKVGIGLKTLISNTWTWGLSMLDGASGGVTSRAYLSLWSTSAGELHLNGASSYFGGKDWSSVVCFVELRGLMPDDGKLERTDSLVPLLMISYVCTSLDVTSRP